MDKYTILYLLEEMCDRDFIKQLNQKQIEQKLSEMEQLFQDKLSLSIPKSSLNSQNSIIAIRDLQCRLIQKNNESVRQTLTQLEELEENIMIMLRRTQYDNSMRTKLRLIGTTLSQTKENIKKIALLEMEQIVIQLLTQTSIETIHIQILLQLVKLNYRYYLGYDFLEETDIIESFFQIEYAKNNTSFIDKKSTLDRTIYLRTTNAEERCKKFITNNINRESLESLEDIWVQWKKEFKKQPIEGESIATITALWFTTVEKVAKILRKKPYDNNQIKGQLDLWNYQKVK